MKSGIWARMERTKRGARFARLATVPLRAGGLLALALGLIACSYSAKSPPAVLAGQDGSSGTSATAPTDASTVLTVFLPGGQSVPFSLRQLRALPQATLRIRGEPSSGPPLDEILEATGVADFRTATLVGKKSVSLPNAAISPQVILRWTSQGTLDLVGEQIPRSDWVRNVHEIHVQ